MLKFVYFDVGGVIIKDFSGNNKWQEMKHDLGVRSDKDQEFDDFFDGYEKKVNSGLGVETALPIMEKRFGLKFPAGYNFLSDFVDRFEKNESIWPILELAKSKYSVGLLTNMYPGMLDLTYARGIMPKINLDVIVNSCVFSCRKPEKMIYQIAEDKCGFCGSEILFIDNSKSNVDAAEKFGWQVYRYDPTHIVASNKILEELL